MCMPDVRKQQMVDLGIDQRGSKLPGDVQLRHDGHIPDRDHRGSLAAS